MAWIRAARQPRPARPTSGQVSDLRARRRRVSVGIACRAELWPKRGVAEGKPDGAAELVSEATDVADGQFVRPVAIRIREVRASMRPWQDSGAVRQLDERLASIL